LFYFVKNPAGFTFHGEKLENRIPSARQLVYADSRANPQGRLPDDTWLIRPAEAAGEFVVDDSQWPLCGISPPADLDHTFVLRPQDLSESFKPDEDTWYFPRVAGTFKERAGFHGCQMPEQLLGRIIRSCSNEGDLIMDPFSGSATTLAVAKKLGRRYLGFDISSEYVASGTRRLQSVCVGDPLEGSAEPLLSAPRTRPPKAAAPKPSRTGRLRPATEDRQAIDDWYRGKMIELTRRGILEAYAQTYRGYSLDRVVADPELNGQFVDYCQRIGLVGNARVWNTLLFALRKTGKLVDFPTTERTLVSWEECDAYLFASEIACAAVLKNQASSLDEILCDPALAARFDVLASEFAPGHRPVEYRWAALKLRKQAKIARSRGSRLNAPFKLHPPILLEGSGGNGPSQIEELADAPGIYLVIGDGDKPLYIGETVSLKKRLSANFHPQRRRAWLRHGRTSGLSIQTFVTNSQSSQMLAWESCFLKKYATEFNIRELRVAE
jgi:site-specific DNA-methyltransferase (adenine-specific)